MSGLSAATHALVEFLGAHYDRYAVREATPRLTASELATHLAELAARDERIKVTFAGKSAAGRPIHRVTFGEGRRRILMWTQMHGDEPTATLAALDLLAALAAFGQHPALATILKETQACIIPMLNPDGAEAFQRRTAQGIDLNRDARYLRAPEARILKRTHDDFVPDYAFNLHDQNPRYTVGDSRRLTAMAFLAPAHDASGKDNVARRRAKRLAAALVSLLAPYIAGYMARFDDAYEPRSFGDAMQGWGTSVVLVESGGWRNDPGKAYLRKLNAMMLLGALHAIAGDEFDELEASAYESLPSNTRNFYDLIFEDATLDFGEGIPSIVADIAVDIPGRHPLPADAIRGRVMDVGDLRDYEAGERWSLAGQRVSGEALRVESEIEVDALRALARPVEPS
ncbi:MAG: peptidase M14 [Chloracidobacterium sp. CP2_5A]|nr:MAG: peptidase M14 [Chloracidobacterium sp. CP2_5A]